MNAFTILDQINLHAPIGIQFRDATDLSIIGDGLNVTIRGPGASQNTHMLTVNGAGYWIAPRLPAISAALLDDPDDWPANAQVLEISVNDNLGRFIPCRFNATLPQKGSLKWAAWNDHSDALKPVSPKAAPAGHHPEYIPLFPAPNYNNSGSRLIIRGQIFTRPSANIPAQPVPVSWAVVRVDIANPVGGADLQIAMGVADAKGQLTLAIPAPELPRGPQPVIGQYRWDATIRIYHDNLGADQPSLEQIIAQHHGPAKRILNNQPLILGQPLILKTNPLPANNPSGLYLVTA